MKTIWNARDIASIFLFAIVALALGCESQGGKSAEELSRETDAILKKQENKTAGIERLRRELAVVPGNEQLTKEPYRGTLEPYILERQDNGEYKFYSAPVEDYQTGEFPPVNMMTVALIDYKKVDAGPFVVPEKNITIPGYRLDAEVTLIDHTIPAVIHRKTFKGESPKPGLAGTNTFFIKEGAKEVLGEKPIDEVEKWVRSLPFRKK